MSNSSLSTLRTRIKRLLNAVEDDFWTDPVLNELIQNKYDLWYRKYSDVNPAFGTTHLTMTYNSSLEKEICCWGKIGYDVSGGAAFVVNEVVTGGTSGATATVVYADTGDTGSYWLKTVVGTFQDAEPITGDVAGDGDTTSTLVSILGEDFPEVDEIKTIFIDSDGAYIPLEAASSYDTFFRWGHSTAISGTPYWYLFEKKPEIVSGVQVVVSKLYLRDIPGSATTLKLVVKSESQTLSSDTYTTGLPSIVEACLVYDVCADARLMEEKPEQVNLFRNLLMASENEFNRYCEKYGQEVFFEVDEDALY